MPFSIQEWLDHYMPQLRGDGVSEDDALAASLLGADIVMAHQACYGDDNMPVNFVTFESPYPELGGCVASCVCEAIDGAPDSYTVCAAGIVSRLTRAWNRVDQKVDPSIVRFAIAAHEVRHRIQVREPAIRTFRRAYTYLKRWTDQQALVIATSLEESYLVDASNLRDQGCAEQLITFAGSDREFDADMVERLLLHRHTSINTFQEIATFLRMNAPVLL